MMKHLAIALIGLSVLTSSQALAQLVQPPGDLVETLSVSPESFAAQATHQEEWPVVGVEATPPARESFALVEYQGETLLPANRDMWVIDPRVTLWARSEPDGIPTTGTGTFRPVGDPPTDQFFVDARGGTRSATFDVAPGFGITARRYLPSRDHYLELSYFGLNEWDENWRFQGERLSDNLFPNVTYGDLFTPFTDVDSDVLDFFGGPRSGIGGFDRADQHEFSYESRIHNAEVNLRIESPNGRRSPGSQPGISRALILGVRYFSLYEDFTFVGKSQVDVDLGGGMFDTFNSTGVYDISTSNHLIGPQVGLDLGYRRGLWGLGVEARIAPSINLANQKTFLFSDAVVQGDPFTAAPLEERRSGSREPLALVGDVSFVGNYEIVPNVLVQASWDMVFLAEVAMAPEQIQWVRNPTSRVNTGYLSLQGLSCNLIWTR